jgi:chromatin structure-remodeling complex subunit RSC9
MAQADVMCSSNRTHFDPEPKVGPRHIDILHLYNRVVGEGGYDLVSDTKAKPLMWRRFAEEFIGKNQYTPAQAFQIKNVYYKNLCAYEISTHWGKEPPPKEILEDVTAKGGNVMSRTLENFTPRVSREQENLQNGDASDSSPEQKTPREEKMDDDPGSATGRSTRGLRHQPPQRVLFQPDLTSGRHTRGQGQASNNSPAPTASSNGIMNASSLSNGASSTLASWEPSQSYPLSLKPVITPANNPEFYRNERKRKIEASAGPLARKYRNIMLPGTGFIGPNIYVRAQLALQSGIPEEEQYALHHLVKISHERGEKYRFDQFPGLAESLVKKVLQVSSLFYDVEWDVTYEDEFGGPDEEMLNGLRGTSHVIQKLRSRLPRVTNDSMLDAAFMAQLNRITEAGLIIRNMCMLDDNAKFLSSQPLIRDYLAVVMDLPQHSQTVELRHYALETAEQVLKYSDIGPNDALYHGLLDQLGREDRGAIAIALRTISRIGMALPPPKRLEDIPDEILLKVQDWLMVEDEELRSACLDFFMQYTSFSDNVDNLLQAIDAESLARQLSRLLLFAAREHKDAKPPKREEKEDSPQKVPRLSRSVVESLLQIDEPERSSEWLRMCFSPDPTGEMTQISLWQSYQSTFGSFQGTHPHLIAGDFIKNVSNTFAGATAQVAGSNKYVIRGIRARKAPVEAGALPGSKSSDKGKELQKCCWRVMKTIEGSLDPTTLLRGPSTTMEGECAEFFRTGEDIFKHILNTHLQLPSKRPGSAESGDKMDIDSKPPPTPASTNGLTNGTGSSTLADSFDFKEADQTTYSCKWSDCDRTSADFDSNNASRTALLVRHIQTHLPSSDATKSKHNLKPDSKPSSTLNEHVYLTTIQDEKGEAAGVPLGAALVLRNIAKFMPQSEGSRTSIQGIMGAEKMEKEDEKEEGEEELMGRIFDEEVRERLFFAMAQNRTISRDVASVLRAVRASGG